MKLRTGTVIALAACLLAFQVQAAPDWDAALNGEHRSEENKQRNQYRHPRQTLEFFGFEPDMTVVEIWPGGGWYTEVLAPLLREEGTFYAAHFSPNAGHGYFRRSLGGFLTRLGENHDLYSEVIITELQPPLNLEMAPAGSVDLVVTFRNVHSWMRQDMAEDVLAASFQALRSGGVLGLVQHRSPPGRSVEDMTESGYVTEEHVIAMVEAAGFELADRDEINANPKDTADHPKGVWTLPPSLRLGDEKRDHYLGIGESDRMTLKFVKP